MTSRNGIPGGAENCEAERGALPDMIAGRERTYLSRGYVMLPAMLDAAARADAIARIEAIQAGIHDLAASFLRVMTCLDAMSAENGGTGFIPGSHLLDDSAARAAGAVTKVAGMPSEFVTCPPGSLVLIHPKALHGGAPNHGVRRRRNFVAQWGRAGRSGCRAREVRWGRK